MVLQRAFPAGALGPVSDTPVLTCCIYLLLGSPPGAQGTGVSVVQQAGMQSHVQGVMLRAPAGGTRGALADWFALFEMSNIFLFKANFPYGKLRVCLSALFHFRGKGRVLLCWLSPP